MTLSLKAHVGAVDTYAQLSEALGRIRSAPSPAAVWDSVKHFAAHFGYSHLFRST